MIVKFIKEYQGIGLYNMGTVHGLEDDFAKKLIKLGIAKNVDDTLNDELKSIGLPEIPNVKVEKKKRLQKSKKKKVKVG